MIRYEFFKEVEPNTQLLKFFNMVFDELGTLRLVSCPDMHTYKDLYGNRAEIQNSAILYFETCLLELYLHSIPQYLSRWKEMAEKYNTEFNGSWKYYALDDKRSLIEEYGGEDDDYDADGSIRTDFTDDELKACSIVTQMVDHNHIFLTTQPWHLATVYKALQSKSEFNVFKVLEKVSGGKRLKTYRKGANGEMIENTWEDERLKEATDQYVADSIAEILCSVVTAVSLLVTRVEELRYNKDNKKFFATLPSHIDDIMELRIKMYTTEGVEKGGQ